MVVGQLPLIKSPFHVEEPDHSYYLLSFPVRSQRLTEKASADFCYQDGGGGRVNCSQRTIVLFPVLFPANNMVNCSGILGVVQLMFQPAIVPSEQYGKIKTEQRFSNLVKAQRFCSRSEMHGA